VQLLDDDCENLQKNLKHNSTLPLYVLTIFHTTWLKPQINSNQDQIQDQHLQHLKHHQHNNSWKH